MKSAHFANVFALLLTLAAGIVFGYLWGQRRPVIKSCTFGTYQISSGWDSANKTVAVWQLDTKASWYSWTRLDE